MSVVKKGRRRALVVSVLTIATAVLVGVGIVQTAHGGSPGASWPFAGQDVTNTRNQGVETGISPVNAPDLAVKWAFTTHGDVSATPTVANGIVYFPDFGGYLNAVNAKTGALVWQRQTSAIFGPCAVSRTSPAIYGNEVIIGDNYGRDQPTGAHVAALDAQTGALLWKTQVDANRAAQVTANPVVAVGKLIVGVASNEEGDTLIPGYPCCTFRGSVVALNPATGAQIWKTWTVPDNGGQPCAEPNPASGCGYSGGGVWDTPAIDPNARRVYLGTGNNYTAPDAANACKEAADASNTSDTACTAADDYFDTALALDLDTGNVVWSRKVAGWDAWNVACAVFPLGATWCPSIASPDYDFGGAGPNILHVKMGQGAPRTVIGLGQKSGVYWAFDAATGATVWSSLVGPGSSLGGIEWATAYDGKRIYVPNANFFGIPFMTPDNQAGHGGSWSALDPATGSILWQKPTPGDQVALGGASSANGVVFTSTMASGPSDANMFALDAATGATLWSFAAGGSVNAAPAIVDGTVYWGSGYAHLGIPPWTTSNKFYAFSIKGK
jgi:polyvinyl alcohol dehydrogenase (cytochrome)